MILNVTQTNKPRAKRQKKILRLGLLFDRGWCYYQLHNLRRASSTVGKQIPERWVLFVLRFFKKRFLKRFPRTPSKVLNLSAMSNYVSLTLLESSYHSEVVLLSNESYTETMTEPTRGRPKSSKRLSKEKKASTVAEDQIIEVFNYWVSTCKTEARRPPVLDEKRRLCIGAAIHDYGVEDCRNAIDGCTMSDFHMGRNKANKKYNDVELILRDSEHIERFLEMYEKAVKDPW